MEEKTLKESRKDWFDGLMNDVEIEFSRRLEEASKSLKQPIKSKNIKRMKSRRKRKNAYSFAKQIRFTKILTSEDLKIKEG